MSIKLEKCRQQYQNTENLNVAFLLIVDIKKANRSNRTSTSSTKCLQKEKKLQYLVNIFENRSKNVDGTNKTSTAHQSNFDIASKTLTKCSQNA